MRSFHRSPLPRFLFVVSAVAPLLGAALALMLNPSLAEADPYYLRSTAGQPWHVNTNELAMDDVFGVGDWVDARYETIDPATLFSNSDFIFMEGGDNNANEMESFLNTNAAAINSFVNAGGVIFFNAAPNEGNGMNFGFGVSLIYNPGPYCDINCDAVDGLHPIFNGPFLPAGTSFGGTSFSHAITGGSFTPLINDLNGNTLLAELAVGSGFAIFGGMTTTNWHSPQPNADNLRRNIIAYGDAISAQCFVIDAIDDQFSVINDGTTADLLVLANEECDNDTPISVVEQPGDLLPDRGGSATTDGTTVSYTPAEGFVGVETFTYTAQDAGLEASTRALFSPPTHFPAGIGPLSVAVADFDGDSAADLVTANGNRNDVNVLLGNGDGSFQAAVSFAASSTPLSVAVADFDGDTSPDIATANGASDDVSVLMGNGDGSFQAAVAFAAGDSPRSVAVADLDGDSVADLVTANYDSDDVSVLLGNGDGTFQAAAAFAAGSSPLSVAVADFDGDSVPDIVTANQFSDDVSVLLGNGDGTFQAAAGFAAGDRPVSVAVADLDGDSAADLVTANRFSDDVSVLLGNGDGSFQAAVFFAAGDGPRSIAVADLDGDSAADLVTANGNSNDVNVLLGNGDGSFHAAVSFAAGDAPQSVAAADFDGGTFPDLVTANFFTNDVSVLLNTGDSDPPTVDQDTATVVVDVLEDLIPDAVDDTATTLQTQAVIIDVLANDSLGNAPNGVAIETGPANGSATLQTDDTIQYSPNFGFFGDDSFEYRVTDANGDSDVATVTVCVFGGGQLPIDIMPSDPGNNLNLRAGSGASISVAVLSASVICAAPNLIDPLTLEFGPGQAGISGNPRARDVDGDGDQDLVVKFLTNETGIACGDTQASLSGSTFDSLSISGSDATNTFNCPRTRKRW